AHDAPRGPPRRISGLGTRDRSAMRSRRARAGASSRGRAPNAPRTSLGRAAYQAASAAARATAAARADAGKAATRHGPVARRTQNPAAKTQRRTPNSMYAPKGHVSPKTLFRTPNAPARAERSASGTAHRA